jgi:protein dithiol oxidoreductase (disulfide-forming)
MSINRRQFHQALLAALASASLPAAFSSAEAAALVEGRDWEAINPPLPGDSPGKIEVLEFFSYGCSHCNEFNPMVHRWAAKLPRDLSFRRVPVSFNRAAWSNLSRLYYSLEATGHLARLDQAVFDAIHLRKANLYTEQAAIDWAASQGINAKTFRDAMRSFTVDSRVMRSEQLSRAYKVKGVPFLTVDGRFAVVGQAASHLSELLVIANGLITKARSQPKR